jgi:LmbE family N-acetylglucosaminyl deacetylase
MLKFKFLEKSPRLNVMCLGSHPDDIEIGCGGTILRLGERGDTQFFWSVLSGNAERGKEARKGANAFLERVKLKKVDIQQFRESYFPFAGAQIKDYFEKLKKEFSPDLILTHHSKDAHQDHRLVSDLTWNTFRDHLILEYEIPKYDGDLRTPNFYVHLDEPLVKMKTSLICSIFKTQKKKQWFTEETFRSILRIRGVESNSPSKYAEAFHCRKIVF